MPLTPEFQFSKSKLQDYVDCPRRFELKHLLLIEWPALQSEPVLEQEHHMEQGRFFHQMIQQHLLGLPLNQITKHATEPDLQRWWENYVQSNPTENLPTQRYPEYRLSIPFAGFRLTAQYDLLAINPGKRFVIVDWKTSNRRYNSAYLKKRVQTRLYPYLLVEGGNNLNGGRPIPPEQVEMIYWFSDYPDELELYRYNRRQHQLDGEYFLKLIRDICNLQDGTFSLIPNEKHCQYCIFRSLCNRGDIAGNWFNQEDDSFEDSETDIDFEQIGEIEF